MFINVPVEPNAVSTPSLTILFVCNPPGVIHINTSQSRAIVSKSS